MSLPKLEVLRILIGVVVLPASAFALGPISCHELGAEPWHFFHPYWKQEVSRRDVLRAHLPIEPFRNTNVTSPLTLVQRLVEDPENRIEREFKVTEGLRAAVFFWMQVHALYGRQIRLIHDKNHLAIIYGSIDLRELYHVCGNIEATGKIARRIEQELVRNIQTFLLEAAGINPPRLLSTDERDALRLFLNGHSIFRLDQIATLAGTVRTQTGQRDDFRAALQRSRDLLPHIEGVFRQKGLPVALARIPFVESSFNPRAHSKVGAVGIWQFMPGTARQMMHTKDPKIWADPLKQTVAVVQVLKKFRAKLPDWSTTVTAYNSGDARMKRLVKKFNAVDLSELRDQSESELGFAGRNFYPQFLSANLVEAYKEMLFHGPLEPADYFLATETPSISPARGLSRMPASFSFRR